MRRRASGWLLAALCVVGLTLGGCDWDFDGPPGQLVADVFWGLLGDAFPPTQELTERPLKRFTQRFNDIAIRNGTVEVSGNLFSQEPPFDTGADVAFPLVLRVIIRRQTLASAVIETRTFDLAVQSNGQIASQSFGVPQMIIAAGEQVAVAIQPIGGNLPASVLNVRVRYRQS
jgi:hypothetical protein